jgi:adenylate cyclase
MQQEPESSPRASILDSQGADLAYLEGLFGSEVGWPLAPVVGWVIEEGRRIAEPARFFGQLCGRLIEAGAPVWRFGLDVATIHPRFAAWQLTWTRENHRVNETRISHGFRDTVAYVGSPAQSIHETGTTVRYRLDCLDPKLDHPYLFHLAARGGTDYVALPVEFSTGEKNLVCIATDCAGGFSELDLAKFRVLAELIALPLESFVAHCTALALLDTYVGPRAGRRVLQGRIRRGDGEAIDAAIWYSDLRDFTPLSESLPWERLLEMLNAYFEFIDAAVTAQGGEILHFIGDAVLVVFPTSAKAAAAKPAKPPWRLHAPSTGSLRSTCVATGPARRKSASASDCTWARSFTETSARRTASTSPSWEPRSIARRVCKASPSNSPARS